MKGVPTEEDWGSYVDDLDSMYAHKIFFGKTNQEMQPAFQEAVIERVDELRWMPPVPFQYYILGLRDYVMNQDTCLDDRSDAASCFLTLVTEKAKDHSDYIKPVLNELMPAIKFVADNQSLYDANEEIYGDFRKKEKELLELL